MINHLEIDNQSMDHMMEDKAEQQQLTMTLSSSSGLRGRAACQTTCSLPFDFSSWQASDGRQAAGVLYMYM